jgi:DNA-directed RNA polymerase subunit RPC12/RpoP
MGQRWSREDGQKQFMSLVQAMHDELYAWRENHPEATLDEIAAQVTPRRRQLMGELIAQLACQEGHGARAEGIACPDCGQPMVYKGDVPCTREHLEGEITLKRAYYFCPKCQQKVFPP